MCRTLPKVPAASALLAALLVILFVLAGCASKPQVVGYVEPVYILDSEADTYGCFAPDYHKDLLRAFVARLGGEEYASKFDRFYKKVAVSEIVFSYADTRSAFTAVALGKFPPKSQLGLVLTPKNGWTKFSTSLEGAASVTCYLHTSGIQLCFPTKKMCILSTESVVPTLRALHVSGESASEEPSRAQKDAAAFFNATFAKEGGDRPFYLFSAKPENIVRLFLGQKITFGIDTLAITANPVLKTALEDKEGRYTADCALTLLDSRAMPAAQFILKAICMALTPITGSPVELSVNKDGGTLTLQNLPISYDTFIDMIPVRKPD